MTTNNINSIYLHLENVVPVMSHRIIMIALEWYNLKYQMCCHLFLWF